MGYPALRIRVIGAGWFGCNLSYGLLKRGHDVELAEQTGLFAGASGGNPARLHQGFHYPRSRLTRAFCQEHQRAFLGRYGGFTRHVPINIYAVALDDSLVDFGTYCQVLRGEVDFIPVYDPSEFGLVSVEGAIQTNERHIVIRKVRAFFEKELAECLSIGQGTGLPEAAEQSFDWTIDCTFCAKDSENIDRYEACITVLLRGPTDKAVTIMDGPFPSIYPWDEEFGLSSLTSARFTPLSKHSSYEAAKAALDTTTKSDIAARADAMLEQMRNYWPSVRDFYTVADYRLGIRAMPKSAADARLVDIVRTGERSLRVRAGKIDAVIHAENQICEMIGA